MKRHLPFTEEATITCVRSENETAVLVSNIGMTTEGETHRSRIFRRPSDQEACGSASTQHVLERRAIMWVQGILWITTKEDRKGYAMQELFFMPSNKTKYRCISVSI